MTTPCAPPASAWSKSGCRTAMPAPASAMRKRGRSPTPSPTAPPPCSTSPTPRPGRRLAEVVKVAHAADVPVIVDAAAQLPPQSNLRRFIEIGADLVAFSGGKALNGPQGTGILAGRRDLVMAAALQHLDLDIVWEQWNPPATLIDKARLKGIPQHGIGRPCKVGKEQIIGVLTALELFVAEGDAARHQRWRGMMEALANGLQGVPGAKVALHGIASTDEVPVVTLTLERSSRLSAIELVIALQDGSPAIQADPLLCEQGTVTFNPMCLQPGEAEIVGAAVRQLLRA